MSCVTCGVELERGLGHGVICPSCDNSYSEWLKEMGYVVGEFDNPRHEKYVPEPHKGTKWIALES